MPNDDQIIVIEKTKYPINITPNLNTDLIQSIGARQMFKIDLRNPVERLDDF